MTRRLGIAMVAACPFPSARGTPIRIQHLATALADRGHDVHLVTYHLGDPVRDPPFQLHRTVNLPTYRKRSPGPTYQKLLVLDFLLAGKIAKVLHHHRIDVIHAHHFEGLITALCARRRREVPLIFDAHTLLESELPFYRLGLTSRAKQRLGRALDTHLPSRADHVVAVAERIRDRLVIDHGLPPDRVSVIPNGVECETFENVASAAPVGNGMRILLFTGNLAAYQGIDLMLQALAELLQMRNDVRLRVVSNEPFDDLEARAKRIGVRHALDLVRCDFSHVPGHLAAADVALNPRTDCDGVPQKLLNYMAAGRPIVTFAGSATHLARGDMGLVIPDGDVRGFALAVHQLLDQPDLARRFGENARRFVLEHLSWDGAARTCEMLYDRLVGRAFSAPASLSP